jgi:hypothetical protein
MESNHTGEHHHEHHEAHHTHGTLSKARKQATCIEDWLVNLLQKAPHLPNNFTDFLVTILPWLALILGALSLVGLLFGGLIATLFSPLTAITKGFFGILFYLSVIIGVITSVLNLLAFKPLVSKKKLGWDYLFYGFLLSSVVTALQIVTLRVSLSDLVIILLGVYLLFEVRHKYHNS